MKVKKFEAPTMQEALETIKRELGPEAIVLHTKQNKKGFGLLNSGSVEVTAAISERAESRKKFADVRMPDASRKAIENLPADKQAEIYDRYLEKHLGQKLRDREARAPQQDVSPRVANAARGAAAYSPQAVASSGGGMDLVSAEPQVSFSRPITTTRYADIDSDEIPSESAGKQGRAARDAVIQRTIAEKARQAIGIGTPVASGAMGLSLQEEVTHLKRMLQELKENQDADSSPSREQGARGGTLFTSALRDAFDHLVVSGLERRNALELLKKAGFELGPEKAEDPALVEEQVAHELIESIETLGALAQIEPRSKTGSLNSPLTVALVGPTGVGKTTTIAKIASEAILKRGLKVGLVNLDSYKVAAVDQLATYAKILNVPFRSAGSAEDLRAAIHDFKGMDLILVDTTGRSQKDPESLKEMEGILHSVPNLQTQLVLSATTRDAELHDMANRFSIFLPQGLVFSKLDEATTFGALYNTSQKSKLPLMYFTTGQRVPEDLEEATRERLVSLILGL